MSDPAHLDSMVSAIAARVGLPLQEDRKASIINGFIELEAMCALLRSADLQAADEPANIYGFDPITRIV